MLKTEGVVRKDTDATGLRFLPFQESLTPQRPERGSLLDILSFRTVLCSQQGGALPCLPLFYFFHIFFLFQEAE